MAKKETTYGTNSTPAAVDAILVRNLDITPQESEIVSRDLIRPYLGASEQLLANTRVRCTIEVELAGSGTAGTAPKFGPLLQACGLGVTTVATTSNTYAPVSTAFSSCTIVYNIDGVQHTLTGCRGTVSMNCQLGQIPTLSFEMTGIYNGPTDTAAPTGITYVAATPLIFKEGNTSAFSFYAYSGCLSTVSLQLANNIVYRELVGCTKEVLIVDRQPTGEVQIEAPTIATKDYFSIALATATGNLTFTHGTTAGNRVVYTAPTVDILNPTYTDMDGIHMLTLPYVPIPTGAGNNEFTLAFT